MKVLHVRSVSCSTESRKLSPPPPHPEHFPLGISPLLHQTYKLEIKGLLLSNSIHFKIAHPLFIYKLIFLCSCNQGIKRKNHIIDCNPSILFMDFESAVIGVVRRDFFTTWPKMQSSKWGAPGAVFDQRAVCAQHALLQLFFHPLTVCLRRVRHCKISWGMTLSQFCITSKTITSVAINTLIRNSTMHCGICTTAETTT